MQCLRVVIWQRTPIYVDKPGRSDILFGWVILNNAETKTKRFSGWQDCINR